MNQGNPLRRGLWVLLYPLLLVGLIFGQSTIGAQDKDTSKSLTMFFIGRRDSKIEPCGCKKNPRGGVQFEARMYSKVPREHSLRVDSGGFGPARMTPDGSMRTSYSIRAMGGDLDLDAVNVSRIDLQLGEGFFESLGKKHPGSLRPLISANIFSRKFPDRQSFPSYKMVERTLRDGSAVNVLIVGVTSPSAVYTPNKTLTTPNTARDYVITDPNEAMAEVIAEKGAEAGMIVALVYGSWEEAVEIAKANQEIDIMVAASRPPRWVKENVTVEGNTKIMAVHNSEGKELGIVEITAAEEGQWKTKGDPKWKGVDPAFEPVESLVSLIEEYKQNTTELILQVPSYTKRVFTGARTCQTCHSDIYASWQKTPHASALKTLVEKGMQYDPSCLKCHTVGFSKDNGFYNTSQSRPMANVQCESCHGAGAEHADTQNYIRNRSINALKGAERTAYMQRARSVVPAKEVSASTCLECHTPDNDDHFVYDEKVHKVNHSDILQQAAKAAGG